MVIDLHDYYARARQQIGRDALYLTAFCFDADISQVLGGKRIEVSQEALKNADKMLERRINGEPLQYIKGECEFYGLNFKVGEGVLIPRADTETAVEAVLEVASKNAKIADLCSGSGCIAVSLKKNLNSADIYAYEISDKAISYLTENAKLNDVDIKIIKADVTQNQNETNFDIIVSNPPYLTGDDMNSLQKEVTFEPKTALFGGNDGLDFYRKITEIWADKIVDNGYLIYEIGINQQDAVAEILENSGFCEVEFKKDINGIIRTVCGRRRKKNG